VTHESPAAFRLIAVLLTAGNALGATDATYDTHAQLSERISRLVEEHPNTCSAESIGISREGRAVWAVRIARPGPVEPDRRAALLLVANIDGDHLIGSAVALEVAERLLGASSGGDEDAVRFLTDHTLYVVPRVNPDAAERFFVEPKADRRRNLRPDDRDRDGATDEDPPNDLNGDGLITMMRVFDPDEADMMADSDEPRLNVKPDRDKGERARFRLEVEGIDEDGDGELNEDGIGGVDLNMNFMHGYREHADGAGPHQVSEPESLALLKFVLEHQNIAVVLTYGRHDNLTKTPDGKGTDPAGAPKNIDAKDAGLYRYIGERFKEITGLKKAPSPPAEGAFFAWAYAQFGVPSFATSLWTRPEPQEKQEEPTAGEPEPAQPEPDAAGEPPSTSEPRRGGERRRRGGRRGARPDADADAPEGRGEGGGSEPGGTGEISQETIDELRAAAEDAGFEISDEMLGQMSPARIERFARRMGIEVRRVAAKSGDGAQSKEDAAWLTYSDEVRDGAGFVAWQKFDHPDLGEVEIGGWVPYFKTNPPPEEIAAIAEKQTAFVLDLAGRFPQVSLTDPQITHLAAGLYEIKAALVNDGYLPTGTAIAVRNRRARPYVVRLSVPNEQVVSGRRVVKVWSIAGSGGRESLRWIVAAPDGAPLTITVYSEKFGQFERTVNLADNQGNGGGS